MRVVSCGEAKARESQKSKRGQHGIDKSSPEGGVIDRVEMCRLL
jgi:hypothetical protein